MLELQEVYAKSAPNRNFYVDISDISDPVVRTILKIDEYQQKIDAIRYACMEVAPDMFTADDLFRSVTEGLSYDILNVNKIMRVGRNEWYKIYRAFFYELSKRRDNL